MNGSSALQALQGKRIGILGYGLNNANLVLWLLRQGLSLTVRDKEATAQEKFKQEHPEFAEVVWEIMPDITENLNTFDVVFRSPGMPYFQPAFEKAVQAGITVTSQTKLFFQLAPCEIIGVTGSKGKGTTSTLIANILTTGYTRGKTYLAGNIGLDPFSFIDDLNEEDLVVLELSSFQLTDLHMSPQVAVMLHVTPEHLDHHGDFAKYREAKRQLVAHQRPSDLAIINAEYPDMGYYLSSANGHVLRYTRKTPQREAAWVEHLDTKEVVFVQSGNSLESIDITGRQLKGEHNVENIVPAILVGLHHRVSPTIIQQEVVAFKGLDHRLSLVGTYNGVSFYDDGIATTPESAIAALEAFPGQRIHLLIGGKSGGQDYTLLVHAALERAVSVSFIPGSDTPALEKLFKKVAKSRTDCECLLLAGAKEPIMETILSGIHPHLQPGDIVILSPAAKSFDHFKDYKERSAKFIHAVTDRYGSQS